MPIIDSNVAIITVKGIQGAELTQSTMEYYPETGAGEGSALEVAQAWIDDTKSDWLDLCSSAWVMLEVRCDKKIDGIYSDATIAVGEAGTIISQSLPVYNTMSFTKNPDNANREPPLERLVGKGRIAVSGLSEDLQDNGIMSPAGLVLANALAVSVRFFTDTSDTTLYMMFIQSLAKPSDPIEVFAPVSSVVFNRLGTQLTRKS